MIWFFLFAVIVLAAAGVLAELRLPGPDREAAPGRFAELSGGDTHYEWGGPVRGPVIVAIHGLTTPSTVWNDIADELGRTGYRVLVYDLPGRGFSDAVAGRQDTAFFVRQLEELLTDQGLGEDLTLLGYSMGGSIATAFAARHPEMLKRLILVAPAGIEMAEGRFERFCRTVPVLGDWLWRVAEPVRMRRRLRAARVPKGSPRWQGIGRRGYFPAVLASRRGILTDRQEAEHRRVSREGVPVLAVWGRRDAVIPIRAMGDLAQWNRTAFHEVVEDADHALPMSHPGQVAAAIREMLRDG